MHTHSMLYYLYLFSTSSTQFCLQICFSFLWNNKETFLRDFQICRFFSCISMMRIYHIPKVLYWSSADYGGDSHTVKSLSYSKIKPELIWILWHINLVQAAIRRYTLCMDLVWSSAVLSEMFFCIHCMLKMVIWITAAFLSVQSRTVAHWIFSLFRLLSLKSRGGCVGKSQQFLEFQPVFRQQSQHVQSSLNPLSSPLKCSDRTLAGHLDHVYMPKCIKLLLCDWLSVRY